MEDASRVPMQALDGQKRDVIRMFKEWKESLSAGAPTLFLS